MIGIIIQARTGSNRFPRKIYEDINGKYTLQRVLEGCTKAQLPHKIILAMPEYDRGEFCQRFNNGEFAGFIDKRFETYFGDADDLVDRYFNAARDYGLDLIVRVTADCPLVQGKIIDEMLFEYLKNNCNGFMGNNALVSDVPYPDGADVEIFPYWMLAETHQLTNNPTDREHVAPFMYRRGTEYSLYSFNNHKPNTIISRRFPDLSFDTKEDLELIKKVSLNYDVHLDLNKAILETVA